MTRSNGIHLGLKHNQSKLLNITFCNVYASNYPRIPGLAMHKYSLKASALLDLPTSNINYKVANMRPIPFDTLNMLY